MTTANGYDPDADLEKFEEDDFQEDALPMLDTDAMSLGGMFGQQKTSGMDWSTFLRKEQELSIDNILEVVRQAKPDDHPGRGVLHSVATAAIYLMNAGALKMKRRIEDLEDRADKLSKGIGEDDKQRLDELYERWSRGNIRQQYLRCQRLKFGLDDLMRREPEYVEHEGKVMPVTSGPRWDWYWAEHEMREADDAAMDELNSTCQEIYSIQQDIAGIRRLAAENRARSTQDIDISDWYKRVMSGEAKSQEKVLGGIFLFQDMILFGLIYEGDKNPIWRHLERMYQGQQEAMSRRNRWRSRRSMSQSEMDGGG